MINFKITAGTALPGEKNERPVSPRGASQIVKRGIQYRETNLGENSMENCAIEYRVVRYWTIRSHDFGAVRKNELGSIMGRRWQEELEARLPERSPLNILDVGTGTGFFAILMAKLGHKVTGIDLTPAMLEEAAAMAAGLGLDIAFRHMDAQQLDFPDGTFDVVLSRNLTWTLPDPESAYREWMRVLKPGGVLLNFDANYGAVDFTDTSDLPKNHAHNQIENTLMQECEDIKRQLSISNYARPAWDLEALSNSGVQQFQIDVGVSQRVYMEKNAFYNPTPLFAVCGKKGDL